MKPLSLDAFTRAMSFVRTRARPVDRALFEYYFTSGPAAAVIEAVANYQNPDGGFGHALEPDFRLIRSSPMATTVAFAYLSEVDAHPDHPVVRGGIEYLLKSLDRRRQTWDPVGPEVNDVPHAPWWTWQGPQEHFRPVCGAECLAYLNAYPALVPEDLLSRLNEVALTYLLNMPEEMELHDLLCYLRLAQEISGPGDILILSKLRRAASVLVARDRDKWAAYAAKPLMLAPTPYAPLADVLKTELEANLDWEIERQSPGGEWAPTWSWDAYPEAWAEARQEWAGHLTVRMLHSLREFGRIEGM